MPNRAKYRVYRADCFEWLLKRRACSIHAVVTDPPFGLVEYSPENLSKRLGGNGGIWRLPPEFDGHKRAPLPRFTVLRPADLAKIKKFHSRLAPLLFKVLVPGGHAVVASQNLILHQVAGAFVAAGFELRGQVARIVKTLRGGDRPKGAHKKYRGISVTPRSCWEPWLVFRKPCEGRVRDNLAKWSTGGLRRPDPSVPFSDLIESSPARGLERKLAPHPSLKPQAFMRQIVWAALPLGRGVVLDPLMGSGSTIAAAEALGLRSIGLETNRHFFRVAAKSIPRLAALSVNGHARATASPTTHGQHRSRTSESR